MSRTQKPFSTVKLPPPLTQDDALILKSSVLKGKPGARDDLIMSHMRVAFTIAGRYTRHGADTEDMTSAALEGVVTAVDKIARGALKHDNVTGYICSYVHRFCTDFIDHNSVVYIPRSQKNKPIIQSLPEGVSDDIHFDMVVFDDLIKKIVKSELDAKVIEFRRQGYTDLETAVKIGVNRAAVISARHSLLKRYKELSDD